MDDYSQPKFYKFSKDSIFLVDEFCRREQVTQDTIILDICCGCGVIGIELAIKKGIEHLTLIECLPEYESHIKDNIKKYCSSIKHTIFIDKFQEVDLNEKVDYIVVNPPYFDESKSRQSIDIKRKTTRSMSSKNFIELLDFIKVNLKEDGIVYLLGREENDLGFMKTGFSGFEVIDRKIFGPSILFVMRLDKN